MGYGWYYKSLGQLASLALVSFTYEFSIVEKVFVYKQCYK